MFVSTISRRVTSSVLRTAPVARLGVRAASTVRFTKEHEYVKVDGKTATCGITNFAQTQLGDVVYVSLPNVGDKFEKGASMASVESVKAASDVYAPVSGTVTSVNEQLKEKPALVNEAAEEGGWFVKMEVDGKAVEAQLKSMLDKAAYAKHCDDSKH